MSSPGLREVSQFDTEKSRSTGSGAYIGTSPPCAATTLAPIQRRLPVFLIAIRRSASVIWEKSLPVGPMLTSLRFRENTSLEPPSFFPLERSTVVIQPNH